MKKIYNQEIINKALKENKIEKYFSNKYDFIIIEYEPEETIINPLEKTKYIQFVIEGTFIILFIDQEGKQTIVSQNDELCILGDMEFVDNTNPMFFAEAKTKVKTLAISLKEYKENLDQDLQFLHTLLNSIAVKFKQSSSSQFIHATVEEQLFTYLNYYGEITHIGQLAISFHCSRRQIQRVLKKYLDQGIIVKEKKGVYKLAESIKYYKD